MNNAAEPIPSVREELERKVVDVMCDIVHKSDTHRLHALTVRQVATALWQATAGLVGDHVSTLLGAATRYAKAIDLPTEGRHFVGKGKVLSVYWHPEGNGYVVVTRDPATGKGAGKPRTSPIDQTLRGPELDNLFVSLKAAGYAEL